MARYKYIHTNPRLLSGDQAKQLLPRTFEYLLNRVLDREVDRSHFGARFRNDATSASVFSGDAAQGGVVLLPLETAFGVAYRRL